MSDLFPNIGQSSLFSRDALSQNIDSSDPADSFDLSSGELELLPDDDRFIPQESNLTEADAAAEWAQYRAEAATSNSEKPVSQSLK